MRPLLLGLLLPWAVCGLGTLRAQVEGDEPVAEPPDVVPSIDPASAPSTPDATALPSVEETEAAEHPVHLVIRASGNDDFVERVRGQIVDLPVMLTEVRSQTLEPERAQRHLTAVRVARRRGAQAVAWFETAPGRMSVYVTTPESGHLLIREIADPESDGEVPSSAALEAGALIVRNAMRSVIDGTPLPTRDRLEPAAEAPDTSASPSEPQAPTAAEPSLGVLVSAGYRVTLDGTGEVPRGGPTVDVGLGIHDVEVRLRLGVQLPTAIANDRIAVDLTRYGALLSFGLRVPLVSRIDGRVAAHAGIVGYDRETVAAGVGLTATEDAFTWSFAAGAEVDARVRVVGPLHIGVAVGTDVAPQAPRLVYLDGDLQVVRSLWILQPFATLFAELDLR